MLHVRVTNHIITHRIVPSLKGRWTDCISKHPTQILSSNTHHMAGLEWSQGFHLKSTPQYFVQLNKKTRSLQGVHSLVFNDEAYGNTRTCGMSLLNNKQLLQYQPVGGP